MNSSIYSNTQTTGRDSYATAVAKNVIVAALYVTINYINGTLVHTFFKHEIFTENPRYILFIHMVLNDMIQLTMAVLLYIISYIFFTMNVSLCCLIIMLVVFTTLNTPLNLAGMAVERYIAVCCSILPDLFILLATEPLYYFLSTIICSRDLVFRHRYLIEKKNISHLVYLSFVWLTLFYTYFRIMFAAKATGADARKARNTILLHGLQLVLCMFTFIVPLFESLLLSLFPLLKNDIRFTIYVFVQILPGFISPVVYGLRDQMFRKYLETHFLYMAHKKSNKIKTQPIPSISQ
ncbi:odorant receptor 131-2-like [Astyanax mexicanus]|uniref:odorant receptor 131-2-like n=1 Tax=Astyanax mexicanus TaxID=7994 RepID=UPI0020CAB7BE|nr:odorant receptor 131-2-like [Astyanax mexicanus]